MMNYSSTITYHFNNSFKRSIRCNVAILSKIDRRFNPSQQTENSDLSSTNYYSRTTYLYSIIKHIFSYHRLVIIYQFTVEFYNQLRRWYPIQSKEESIFRYN